MLDSALEPSLVNYLTKLTTDNVFVSALELSPASFSSAVSLALFLSLPVSRMLAQPTWKCSCLHSLFLSLSRARALPLHLSAWEAGVASLAHKGVSSTDMGDSANDGGAKDGRISRPGVLMPAVQCACTCARAYQRTKTGAVTAWRGTSLLLLHFPRHYTTAVPRKSGVFALKGGVLSGMLHASGEGQVRKYATGQHQTVRSPCL